MKYLIIALWAMFFAGCTGHSGSSEHLDAKIDSLSKKLGNSYRPGLGEFMSHIQLHHSKLWFAGINDNWKLADYELHEMQEALVNIQKFNTDRPEAQIVDVIYPSIDSVNYAIEQKDQQLFKSSYMLLTRTCNDCHKSTAHEFNVITVPSTPPVTDQSFKAGQ